MNLEKCPHCGSKPIFSRRFAKSSQRYFIFIECPVCGARGKAFSEAEDPAPKGWASAGCLNAIRMWNMRTE